MVIVYLEEESGLKDGLERLKEWSKIVADLSFNGLSIHKCLSNSHKGYSYN